MERERWGDYKTVYRLLRKKYPSIFEELAQQPILFDQSMVEPLLGRFLVVKGITAKEFTSNKSNCRLLFIAVATKIFDPLLFVDEEKKMLGGLRDRLAEVANTDGSQISHNLKTVRTYLRAYPSFRKEVDYIYATIVKEFFC